MNSNQQISEKCISIIVRYIQWTVTGKGVCCDFDFKKCVANSENLDPAPSTFKMWESCDTAISWHTVVPQSSPIIICCQLLIPLEFVWIQNPQIRRFIIKNMSAGTPMFQCNNVPLPTRLYWSMLDLKFAKMWIQMSHVNKAIQNIVMWVHVQKTWHHGPVLYFFADFLFYFFQVLFWSAAKRLFDAAASLQ